MSAVLAPDSDLLTREEAARYLGLKSQTLATWVTNKRYNLPVVRIGRNVVRYRRADLEAFVARHADTAPVA